MGNKESNESAAVKRQAEGGAIPMYELADLSGGGILYIAAKRALVKNDTKELDELIRAKVCIKLAYHRLTVCIPARCSLFRWHRTCTTMAKGRWFL